MQQEFDSGEDVKISSPLIYCVKMTATGFGSHFILSNGETHITDRNIGGGRSSRTNHALN